MTTPTSKRGKKPRAAAATAAPVGQVQSLSRGMKLLEYIAEANGSIALTELAQRAGLANSTTHRLLTTLAQQEFVRQVGDLGLWAIGPRAFIVGASFLDSRNLLAMVHPKLRTLMERSGETVNLAVLDRVNFDAIIIDQVQCNQLMRMSASIGGKLPMHASGAGKALLSTLDDERLTQLLHRKGMHAYTPHTLTTPKTLKANLSMIRKQGFSFDDEEHALGLRCVAACLFNEYREPFAAISISGPVSRVTDDRVIEIGALAIQTAKELTRAWGGGAPEARVALHSS
ncbi:glyoxylate bypass operon transcriptional repressor IclR [Halotalea alkalilenta]|uniref:glyoxylate bypass operon transcriptional repressor IclR n=1 Tax=Halotalea alkalilenta TaxID=376489 RepID=UPI0004831E99|nr:glyoxylate bypass operon transcriptional repressor IclR [Halotalea alkalilenta]